jgi:hypothetical protein
MINIAAGVLEIITDLVNEMLSRTLLNLLLGFLIALPFALIRQRVARLILCVAAPLVVYGILLYYAAHAGFRWNHAWELVYVLGALLAAHLREIWQLAAGWSRK